MSTVMLMAGQRVVEGLARELAFDPDAPRGMHKVTQTERDRDRGLSC